MAVVSPLPQHDRLLTDHHLKRSFDDQKRLLGMVDDRYFESLECGFEWLLSSALWVKNSVRKNGVRNSYSTCFPDMGSLRSSYRMVRLESHSYDRPAAHTQEHQIRLRFSARMTAAVSVSPVHLGNISDGRPVRSTRQFLHGKLLFSIFSDIYFLF